MEPLPQITSVLWVRANLGKLFVDLRKLFFVETALLCKVLAVGIEDNVALLATGLEIEIVGSNTTDKILTVIAESKRIFM